MASLGKGPFKFAYLLKQCLESKPRLVDQQMIYDEIYGLPLKFNPFI